MAEKKATIYLASPVFREMSENVKVDPGLRNLIKRSYDALSDSAHIIEATERFPDKKDIEAIVRESKVDFIGCHLSHNINEQVVEMPSLKGIATSSAGYNHIAPSDTILITNTPSVLDKATADYTISMILSNLRNITALHNSVWTGRWTAGKKWDLDANLENSIDSLVLGIVGLGEIGREVVRRIAPWGVKILYFSRTRKPDFEKEYSNLHYVNAIETLFEQSDIVSLHMLLSDETYQLVDETLLKKMKPGSLLVNTARGEVLDHLALIRLLKSNELSIHIALDVFDPEPLAPSMLKEFHEISLQRPDLRMTLLPHNASADADTRAKMTIMMLEDLNTMVTSTCFNDLNSLRLIPSLSDISKSQMDRFKINSYW